MDTKRGFCRGHGRGRSRGWRLMNDGLPSGRCIVIYISRTNLTVFV